MDWTFSIGNLLTVGAMLLAFIGAHIQNIRRMDRIEQKLNLMFGWWKRTVIEKQGRHTHTHENGDGDCDNER
jgi:hypothetical protein